MLSKIKNNIFLKNSILYTFGSMMTPIIGFIMLPVYTNYLTPSEYGVMSTVQTVAGLIQLILLLALHGAVTRFYYDFLDQPEKQKEYIGTIYLFVFIFSSIISVILVVFSGLIGNIIFREIPIYPYFYYLVGLAWLSALFSLPLALLRVQEKAGTFVLINLLKSIFTVILTFYFLTYKGFGAESALLANIIVLVVVVSIVFIIQSRYLTISFNIEYIKASLLFSLPLLPHVASGWIISSSDRIILEKFVTTEELGIYALAVQISTVLGMFYTSVNSAFIPRYTSLRKAGNEESAQKLLKVFWYVVIFFGILSIPVAMYATKILTSVEYHNAIVIIPLLLIGQIFYGFYFIVVAKLYFLKKTKSIATSSLMAAITNIVINLLLIPIIGLAGAVVSTIVAEIMRVIIIFRASKRMKINRFD